MQVKKAGGKVYGAVLTAAEKKAMDLEIQRELAEYSDPTAYQALKNIEAEEERFHKLLHMIFDIYALSDFEIEGRIVLVDKRSGKVWR